MVTKKYSPDGVVFDVNAHFSFTTASKCQICGRLKESVSDLEAHFDR